MVARGLSVTACLHIGFSACLFLASDVQVVLLPHMFCWARIVFAMIITIATTIRVELGTCAILTKVRFELLLGDRAHTALTLVWRGAEVLFAIPLRLATHSRV